MEISVEFQYFIVFASILILPKILLRYGIPTALTALALGFATTFLLGWFEDDQLILMFSRLGITSLFLFAGMEVDLEDLREDGRFLAKHLLGFLLVIFIVAYGLNYIFYVGYRAALMISLALITPSTGFILNSLKGVDLSSGQEHWVRSLAISKEVVAIFTLFFILQTQSLNEFLISTGALIAMILLLPVIFQFFLSKVAPHAPDSEVTFLILIALLCGVITTKLGTYYLVGAFIVGMTAGRFRHFIEHEKSKNVLYSVSFFFSFFVPFYFYRAGLTFSFENIDLEGLFLGLMFLCIVLPMRFLSMFASIWLFLREHWPDRMAITLPLFPNLIFGLVIIALLKQQFTIPEYIISGLMIYTIGSSVLPWFFLKRIPPENYDSSMVS